MRKFKTATLLQELQDSRGPVDELIDDYVLVDVLYHLETRLRLDVSFTVCDTSDEYWIEAKVFVPNLIGDGQGYYVTTNIDFKQRFETRKDLLDNVLREDKHAKRILSHFKLGD